MASQCLSDRAGDRPQPRHRGAGGIDVLGRLGATCSRSRIPALPMSCAMSSRTREAMSRPSPPQRRQEVAGHRPQGPAPARPAARMVRDADVFIENFRPGRRTARARLRGRESRQSADRLPVDLGLRPDGPWSRFGAYDQVVQALTGMMMANGEENGPPTKVGVPGDRHRHWHAGRDGGAGGAASRRTTAASAAISTPRWPKPPCNSCGRWRAACCRPTRRAAPRQSWLQRLARRLRPSNAPMAGSPWPPTRGASSADCAICLDCGRGRRSRAGDPVGDGRPPMSCRSIAAELVRRSMRLSRAMSAAELEARPQ